MNFEVKAKTSCAGHGAHRPAASGALMADALFGSVPVAVVYSFFVENYVSGITSAVKG